MNIHNYLDLHAFCRSAADIHPGNGLFCLADHAGMPGLYRHLVQSGVVWTSLFNESREERALSAAPLLFPLVSSNLHFLKWLEEHGTYASSMLMLSSPLGLDQLGDRLARRIRARISDEIDVLLRFFDPRVFEALIAVLDEEQRCRLLDPADCWWYLDRRGQLRTQPAQHVSEDIFVPLELSAAQEFALLDASEIDQVAAQLRSMLPEAYIRMAPVQRIAFLERHMVAADAAGVVATHEVALYCSLALLHGDEFAHLSPWREILAKVGLESISFVDAVAEHER